MLNPIFTGKHFQKEKDFTGWYGTEHRKAGQFFYKISDQSMGLKPCDAIHANHEGLYMVEVKIIDGYTFNLNAFEDQQIAELNFVWHLCQRSKVLIYSKKTQEYVEILWGDFLILLNGTNSVVLFEKSSRVVTC